MDFIALAAAANGRVVAFSHGHFLRAVAIAWMMLEIKAAAALYLDVAPLSILPYAGQPREDQVGRSVDLGSIRVALARVDEHHLARCHLALIGPIVEMQVTDRDDQRQRNRVSVVRNVLS